MYETCAIDYERHTNIICLGSSPTCTTSRYVPTYYVFAHCFCLAMELHTKYCTSLVLTGVNDKRNSWGTADVRYTEIQYTGSTIWVRSWRCGCLVTWICYQLIAKPGNKTATPPWPYNVKSSWLQEYLQDYNHMALRIFFSKYASPKGGVAIEEAIWTVLVSFESDTLPAFVLVAMNAMSCNNVGSGRCGCLVTWYCYQLIRSIWR